MAMARPPRRHGVEALAHGLERHHGGDERERDRHRRDHAGAPIVQEGEQHDDDENAAEPERLEHVGIGDGDEVRRPEQIRPQSHAFPVEGRAQVFEGGLHPGGDLAGIGAVLRTDHEEHAALAVHQGGADRRLAGGDHGGDVAEGHAGAALVDEDRAGQFLRGERLPLGLEGDALVDRVDEARPAHAGGLAGGGEHVVHADIVADEIRRPDLDLERAHGAAIDRDLTDARDGQKPEAHGPVGDGAQVEVGASLRGQADEEHGAGGRGESGHRRRQHALRQTAGERRQPFGDELADAIDVAAGAEGDGDDRQALDRARPQGFDPRQAVHPPPRSVG